MNFKRVNGLTLIELLVALAVAAILLSLGVPSFQGLILNNRNVTATNNFVFALNLARSEAGKRGVPIAIAATDASDATNEFGNGWVVFIDNDANGALGTGEETLSTFEGQSGTQGTIDSVENVSFLIFKPWGNLKASPNVRTFYICDNRDAEIGKRITIGATGHAKTTQYNCT